MGRKPKSVESPPEEIKVPKKKGRPRKIKIEVDPQQQHEFNRTDEERLERYIKKCLVKRKIKGLRQLF